MINQAERQIDIPGAEITEESDFKRLMELETKSVQYNSRGEIESATMPGLERLARTYAKSGQTPDHYKGKWEDCYVAIEMAMRLKLNPMVYMQNSYVVHGKPGVHATLLIGLLNASKRTKGGIVYRENFDPRGEDGKRNPEEFWCQAGIMNAETGEMVWGEKLSWETVKRFGWEKPKKGQQSKWMQMPGQMFRYRSATFLVRSHFAEVGLGLSTIDELEDISQQSIINEAKTIVDAELVPDADDSVPDLEPPDDRHPSRVIQDAFQECSTQKACKELAAKLKEEQPEQAGEIELESKTRIDYLREQRKAKSSKSESTEPAPEKSEDTEDEGPPMADGPDDKEILAQLEQELGECDSEKLINTIAVKYQKNWPHLSSAIKLCCSLALRELPIETTEESEPEPEPDPEPDEQADKEETLSNADQRLINQVREKFESCSSLAELDRAREEFIASGPGDADTINAIYDMAEEFEAKIR